jgi:hypothetical protein
MNEFLIPLKSNESAIDVRFYCSLINNWFSIAGWLESEKCIIYVLREQLMKTSRELYFIQSQL